jgi:type VI secretion system protein ImpK
VPLFPPAPAPAPAPLPAADTALLDRALPALELVLAIKASGVAPEPREVERALAALNQLGTPGDVDDARYAVVALCDEAIAARPEPARGELAIEPLQMRLFGESTAGEGFFVRLARIRARPAGPLLELYYLCLTLGFQGRYRFAPAGERERLCADIARELELAARAARPLATPACAPEPPAPTGRRAAWWALPALLAAALAAAYAVSGWRLGAHRQSLTRALEELAAQMEPRR